MCLSLHLKCPPCVKSAVPSLVPSEMLDAFRGGSSGRCKVICGYVLKRNSRILAPSSSLSLPDLGVSIFVLLLPIVTGTGLDRMGPDHHGLEPLKPRAKKTLPVR